MIPQSIDEFEKGNALTHPQIGEPSGAIQEGRHVAVLQTMGCVPEVQRMICYSCETSIAPSFLYEVS
jgi:hypothetical protein